VLHGGRPDHRRHYSTTVGAVVTIADGEPMPTVVRLGRDVSADTASADIRAALAAVTTR